MNPDFSVTNGVLVKYNRDPEDKTNTKVEIPASITKIDSKVFYQFKYIEEVEYETGSKLQEIGESAFRECTSLKRIELPEGTLNIGADSFRGCTSVTEIELPSTTQILYKRCFYGINLVKNIELPEGLKKIYYHVFYKMSGLTSLTIPSTVTTTNESIGESSNITKITFSNGMKKIPDKILLNASSVTTVILPTGLTSIGAQAFEGCTKLTSAAQKSTITTIGEKAFYNCVSIKKLTIYKSVTYIGAKAFTGATSLTLRVYANSTGKTYARKNNIKWMYASSEIKRMAEDKRIYQLLSNSNIAGSKGKFQLKSLANYIPQGICTIGSYVVVSMYHKNLSSKSLLIVYDKKGNYIKTVKLAVKDHVGSVTNVKKNLVVGLNNISRTSDYVGVITYKKLHAAKNLSTLKFNYKVKLTGNADFAAFDGTYFWAGKSANSNWCLMYGYKVKVKSKKLTFTNTYNLYVPANTQGLIVNKVSKYKRKFTVSQSYGRIADSNLLVFNSVNIKAASNLGTANTTVVLPSMMEGICADGKTRYLLFESAAGKYCSNQDNTSEIKIANVNAIKNSKLLKIK